MSELTHRELVWLVVIFGLLACVLLLVGCSGHHYYSSTDRKTDSGEDWYETLCPGSEHLPLCWCVDRSDGTVCKPER